MIPMKGIHVKSHLKIFENRHAMCPPNKNHVCWHTKSMIELYTYVFPINKAKRIASDVRQLS